MLPLFDRLKTWWTAADRNQKVVTLGGVGALVLLLLGTAYTATRPRYETFLENLSETDKAQAVEALKTLNIPEQHDRPGMIAVPVEKMEEARMGLATAGKLPKGPNHLSFPDLAKIGPMVSPEVEAQTIKAILEGEIASTLEKMEGVSSASVIITRPKETVFADEKVAPTASVSLVADGMGGLGSKDGRTIANLVSSAVAGMKPEGVYVATSDGTVLWDGQGDVSSSTKGELDAKTSRYWEAKLQGALDPVFGANNTKVVVRADVDTTRTTTETNDVIPTKEATSTVVQSENMVGGSRGVPGGIAGAASNTPDGKAPASIGAGTEKAGQTYARKGKQEDRAISTKHVKTEGGSGDLKELSITVVANSDKVSDVSKVEEIVKGVMGGRIQTDANGAILPNQPFTVAVTSVKFDNTAVVAAKAAADAASGQARTQQILSLLPIGAILAIALLVAKQVGKISRSVLPASPAESEDRTHQGAEALPEPAFEPELTTMPDLEAMIQSHSVQGALPANVPFTPEMIQDRIDGPLESLKQMATDRPQMVATLIKSMMLGERS